MNPKTIAGVVLIAVGSVALIMGLNASDSAADQLTEAFTGHFTDNTTIYILGGIGALVAGLAMTAYGSRGKAS